MRQHHMLLYTTQIVVHWRRIAVLDALHHRRHEDDFSSECPGWNFTTQHLPEAVVVRCVI